MGKLKAPTPPDPIKTAGAQTASNVGTAVAQQQLNSINQKTPDGSLTYENSGTYDYRDPLTGNVHKIPKMTAVQTLSPAQQAIKDQSDKASLNFATLAANQSGRVDGLLSDPIDTSGLPDRGDASAVKAPDFFNGGPIQKTYSTDFSQDRQRVEDALMQRMQGGLDRDRGQLESRLASQGIRVGSEAYEAAMGDHGRQANDARLAAILGAGQEQSRLVGMESQRAGFENSAQAQEFGQKNQIEQQRFNADMAKISAQDQARNQALQEEFAVRNQPINEITALMSGSQVSQPNFVNSKAAQLANTDYAGIQANYDGQMQQRYQQRMSQWNQVVGGAMGMAGGMAMSDRRAKKNIKKVGETNDGQNIYSYRYKAGGPTQLGLMAQEVEKKRPNAVMKVNGLKMVNYDAALGGGK